MLVAKVPTEAKAASTKIWADTADAGRPDIVAVSPPAL